MTDNRDGPVLIEMDDIGPSPADASPIVDPGAPPMGQAMQTAATLASRRPSRLAAWFWRLLLAVVVFFVSVAAWDFVTGLVVRNTYLGWAAIGLLGLFVLVCLAIIVRECAALARLARIENLHEEADRVVSAGDLEGARNLTDKLSAHYATREDTSWGRQALKEAQDLGYGTLHRIVAGEGSQRGRMRTEQKERQFPS